MADSEKKKVILSCIQSSGTPTLGNYLGALKNWKNLEEDFYSTFAVADLHAITVRQDPKVFRENSLSMYALLMAIGLNPDKSILFIQSHNPDHAQLAWLLNCYTQFGELSRMTQFKDKSTVHSDNVNAGLFTYPTLMAADILLYGADYVPVGADQKQHLEITRNIACRFNGIYGNVFKIPEPYIPKQGARVMSLADPTKKMSKSDSNANGFISMLDKPEVILKKFKRAVTDSEMKVEYREGKDGINNLMSIYSCITGMTNEQIETQFSGKGYGDFKVAVAEAVIEELRPIQQKYNELMNDRAYLKQCYTEGAQKARNISHRVLDKAMKKIGFVL